MRRSKLSRGVALLTLALALTVPAATRADTVTEWNAIMQATVTTAPTNPFFQARWGAIVQLAVFEAVNAINGEYEPYLGVVDAPAWAAPRAAVIAAAHRTLVMLRPDSATTLNGLRAAALAEIPDGPEKDAGIAAGEDAAEAMLLLRVDDGWNNVVAYTPGTSPGDWQPTPAAFAPAAFVQWGQVTPFGLETGSQFRLPAPPALHTERYAADYNEVKHVGRIDSPFRPQDRTDVARFFAAATPVQVWNSAARQASAAQQKTLSENARIFALLAMAMADASIATFDSKYYYDFWRPVTAIRNGDGDGNPLTQRDAEWLPLIATPAFPGYPSAHATLSNAARAVLERAYGKRDHDITLVNTALAIELNYTAWDQMTDDIDDARVYGGIHFRFDQDAGAHQGRHVGKYILRNYLRSENEPDNFDDDK